MGLWDSISRPHQCSSWAKLSLHTVIGFVLYTQTQTGWGALIPTLAILLMTACQHPWAQCQSVVSDKPRTSWRPIIACQWLTLQTVPPVLSSHSYSCPFHFVTCLFHTVFLSQSPAYTYLPAIALSKQGTGRYESHTGKNSLLTY